MKSKQSKQHFIGFVVGSDLKARLDAIPCRPQHRSILYRELLRRGLDSYEREQAEAKESKKGKVA